MQNNESAKKIGKRKEISSKNSGKLKLSDKILLELIKEYPSATQKEYADLLHVDQSSITKAFKRNNIIKKNGNYQHYPQESLEIEYDESKLDKIGGVIFESIYSTSLSDTPQMLRIQVEIGSELLLCRLLFENFGRNAVSYMPCYGSICIFSSTKKKLRKIQQFLASKY